MSIISQERQEKRKEGSMSIPGNRDGGEKKPECITV